MNTPRIVAILVILSAYGAALSHRLGEWHSNETIWRAATASDPLNPRAWNNLAHEQENFTQAARVLQPVEDLYPPEWFSYDERAIYANPLVALSRVRSVLGNHLDSVVAYQEARERLQ